jgi:hypothetical protein
VESEDVLVPAAHLEEAGLPQQLAGIRDSEVLERDGLTCGVVADLVDDAGGALAEAVGSS